ncbi:MAG TPA: ATP-binding cassette domain-containing protein [Acidimicrobiia bacterium]|nr:ATP-binding cassette domain-containing protein [Acidimicrobiia bacterium]
MGDAVAATGLRRSFGDTTAVAGVDLAVHDGEIYGFLGPNGAGKSTTVRMLCTLLVPSAGSAHVAGYDVVSQSKDVRLRIGVALQDASLDPNQTGDELLRLQGRLYGLDHAEIDQQVRSLAALVDIGDAMHRRVKTYSGGMKRRLDLAVALVHNPRVLFLDEPTTGLDPASRARVWDEVRRLNEAGKTIFLTTQYLEEADTLADRVAIIDRGEIIAEGRPDDLKREMGSDVIVAEVGSDAARACSQIERVPGVTRVERHGDELTILTPDASALLSPVAVALAECGVPVRNLTMRRPTLDDVYLRITGDHLRASLDGDEEPMDEHDQR